MAYKLVIHCKHDEIVIAQPGPGDIDTALGYLRDETSYVVDILDGDGDLVLQIVDLNGPKALGIVINPIGIDEGHFSVSTTLTDGEIHEACAAFLASGAIGTANVRFDQEIWYDRLSSAKVLPPPVKLLTAAEAPEEIEPETPQEVLNDWIESAGAADLEHLVDALAAGASFAAFSPVPPLVYLAKKWWVREDAIAALLHVGCDISAVHEQGTAVWHAVENCHYDFADSLVLHGASRDEAQSSRYYDNWLKRDAKRAVTDMIDAGDIAALQAWLRGRAPKEVAMDLLVRAVASNQLPALQMLLAYKGRVWCQAAHSESLWGRAMAQVDTGYIDALVRHGAYESVAQLPEYGGLEFHSASGQCLSYLRERGMTAGFERGFGSITSRLRQRHVDVLPHFPDHYFTGLPPKTLLRAITMLAARVPERVDTLLDRTDFTTLVQHTFSRPGDATWILVPLLFGQAVHGPVPRLGRENAGSEQFAQEVGVELAEMANSIANA